MSAESNFSFTTKFNGDLLTVRGDTFDEFLQNLITMGSIKEFSALALALEGKAPAPKSTAEAIAVVEKTFGPVEVISDKEEAPAAPASSVQEKTDKFGNKYVQGSPGTQTCTHGSRVVKYGTSKAGKKYKAFVCVNDSPFGDWKQDKCEAVWG